MLKGRGKAVLELRLAYWLVRLAVARQGKEERLEIWFLSSLEGQTRHVIANKIPRSKQILRFSHMYKNIIEMICECSNNRLILRAA
jgi:hypothetical protein